MEKLELFLNENKPIYIYGASGCGKTRLIKQVPCLKRISIHDLNNMDELYPYLQPSVMDYFHKKRFLPVFAIDDIDELHLHEKKIVTFLLKFLKQEIKRGMSYKLILCGTNSYDKKIKEIMKFCNVIHLSEMGKGSERVYEKNTQGSIQQIMQQKLPFDFMIENEKATQALLFHENIIDLVKTENIDFYNEFLKHFCTGDYFDRISFQKQLWVFNEMTYYLKILHNYYMYRNSNLKPKKVQEYRFTKILTKYSNEYNNNTFIIQLCNRNNCTKKELYYLTEREDSSLTSVELNRLKNYFQLNAQPPSEVVPSKV